MSDDITRALDICGFKPGESFSVAAISAHRDIRAACFERADAAAAFLDGFGGWNHYICGNPVKPGTTGKPSLDDILEARVLLVDADPTGDDTMPVTLAMMALAESLDGRAALIDSGRGVQAWLRVEGLDPEQRRRLARGLAAKFSREGVRFDATHNADRLMRLPGSLNTKTGRTALILRERANPRALTLADLDGLPELPERESKAEPVADLGPATVADLDLVTGDARKVWESVAEKGERSTRDFLFVLALLKAGASEAAACRLLWTLPGGKAREDRRGEDYWRSTLESVRKRLDEDNATRAYALTLPDLAADDVGAALEPKALDALLFFRETAGPAEWARLRARLKAARVPMRDLEAALVERNAAKLALNPPPLRYVAQGGKRIGWFRRADSGAWLIIDGSDARSVFRAYGADVDASVKDATANPWMLVNEPFQPEELPGNRWNKDGARLAFEPVEGPHPTWDMILSNLGRGIDGAVEADAWCQANGLKTGADYLRVWVAKMFQFPKDRGSFLFFHGEQEAGKSLFHEALKLLFTRGYIRANHALTSKDGFNGELANAILCVIEEIDLSDPKKVTHERIKDWVTGKTISIRALYCQAYDVENTAHFVQCANKLAYMAVLPGDTRITSIYVMKVDKEHAVPKEELMARLLAEAPQFISTVTRMTVPAATGRLRVPALSTSDKLDQANASRTDLEAWLETAGASALEMTEAELVGSFLESLGHRASGAWDRSRVLRELPNDVRKDRRLVCSLRAIGSFHGNTSELLERLPADTRRDASNAVSLGRGLTRVASRIDWLHRVKVDAGFAWEIIPPCIKAS